MPAHRFEYYNIDFKRYGDASWVFARGEVANKSEKHFNTAVFRLTLFDRKLLMWSGVFKVMGFRKGQTRLFEVPLDGLDHKQLHKMTKYEIYFESGY